MARCGICGRMRFGFDTTDLIDARGQDSIYYLCVSMRCVVSQEQLYSRRFTEDADLG